MTFSESIKSVYANYATFSGRATRSEYWWFQLYYFLGLLLICALCISICVTFGEKYSFVIFITSIYILAHIVPRLALLVRRLHDTSNSGLWALLILLSGPGVIVLFIFTLLSSSGDNKYGKTPLYMPELPENDYTNQYTPPQHDRHSA